MTSILAGIGIGFYGNSETNDGVYQVTYSLLNANHTLSSIDTLVSETVELLSATVRGDLTQLEETLSPRTDLVAVVRNTRRQAEAVAQTLDGVPFWGETRGGPSNLAEQVGYLEDYRWLAYILLLLLDLIICLFTLLGLAKQIKWLVIVMTVMSFLVLILSWGSMGLETAAAVGLSDFCFEPDGYVMNTTQARTGLSPEILQYYLTCSQDVFNPFQQRSILAIQSTLNTTESNFHHLVALLNCRGLHKDYVDALKGLCYDGMEGLLFLLLFSFLSALSFTTAVCSLPRAWKRFQNRDSDYDDMEDDDPFTPQAPDPSLPHGDVAEGVFGNIAAGVVAVNGAICDLLAPPLLCLPEIWGSGGSRCIMNFFVDVTCRSQSASFSGSPRFESVPLIDRHSPPPSYSPSMRASYVGASEEVEPPYRTGNQP
ncbi:UNVERIFIED_CONTAM: Protein tweety 1 [Gekko kuhli]